MRKSSIIPVLLLSSMISMILLSGSSESDRLTPYPWPELKLFPMMPVSTDNPVTVEGAALGRYLFYDPILSYDSTFSCASCHDQSSAFSDSPKAFSKGINGDKMKRNTMPLFNLAWSTEFHWDGKHASLEQQAFHPVKAKDEMDLTWEVAMKRLKRSTLYPPLFQKAFGTLDFDSSMVVQAIAQFELTLISNNSKFDKVISGEAYFTAEEYNGFVLMNDQTKGDCLHCHTTDADALGTTGGFSNNGLDLAIESKDYKDAGRAEVTANHNDYGHFRIPSLRNIAVTAPYMHDGRLQTLEEVIDFYSEDVRHAYNIDSKMGFVGRGGAHLSTEEKESIIAFLQTLTDSSFLTNPEFSNPFN